VKLKQFKEMVIKIREHFDTNEFLCEDDYYAILSKIEGLR
jgi:hypothetical protein